jgi:homocysteine S-methyltransferase
LERNFLELLERKRVLLCDGAMGTMLYSKGVFINRCFDELNLSSPQQVLEVHKEYVAAGADIIETNTFGANLFKLRPHGFAAKLRDINLAGAQLARQAAGEQGLVAGAMGPLGIRMEPWGPLSRVEVREAFAAQAAALLEGGVDLFILETFDSMSQLQQAIQAIKSICNLPVIAQMTLGDDGNTPHGNPPERLAVLREWGADVLGINCTVGPKATLEALERIRPLVDCPLSAQPNAGRPQIIEGRSLYLASPEYFGEYAKRFIQSGVRVMGGCCGTTPAHIAAMRKFIAATTPETHTRVTVSRAPDEETPGADAMPEVPVKRRSAMARKIADGEFVISVELVPPRGTRIVKTLQKALTLKEGGVDVINIPDGPRASARINPMALAVQIKQVVGIETVLHYTCRDRNLLGMQSDLLGAHVLGIRNLLLVTGDPPKMGDYPNATAVFDVDSVGLTNVVTRLNRGLDVGGNSVGGTTEFFMGVGVNPGATNLEDEFRKLYWKIDAGAQFAMSQPVFDPAQLEDFLEEMVKRNLKLPILAGIWPLQSFRNAQFMNNEVPGAKVPDDIMKRMLEAQDKDRAAEEGIAIAREVFQRVRPLVQGVQLAAPGKPESALDILK